MCIRDSSYMKEYRYAYLFLIVFFKANWWSENTNLNSICPSVALQKSRFLQVGHWHSIVTVHVRYVSPETVRLRLPYWHICLRPSKISIDTKFLHYLFLCLGLGLYTEHQIREIVVRKGIVLYDTEERARRRGGTFRVKCRFKLKKETIMTVSYTHLTLPTILLV